MPRRAAVDLAAHINENVVRGHPADFPVTLKPLYYLTGDNKATEEVPSRLAVVRGDTGQFLSVVSDRYQLVPHQMLLNLVQEATGKLDVGPTPRGIYVDRGGARMRALYKFPALAEAVQGTDAICPCIKIQNTYDTTSRISAHIGAFRFVCTNLAVGGGGVFAGGFMAVHAGEIMLEELAVRLSSYLKDFSRIVETYRRWSEQQLDQERLDQALKALPKRAEERIRLRTAREGAQTVYHAYNTATFYATHELRSARSAFDLLELINQRFQRFFSTN